MMRKADSWKVVNWSIVAALLFTFTYCTTARLQVPPSFTGRATRLPVKGINGWQVNQKLSFGAFRTSPVKRGWDFTSSVQYTKFHVSPQEALLRVFDIYTDNKNKTRRNKFQYTIHDGTTMAEVYATEKFTEKQLVYKSNNPWINNASKTNRYEYAFTAAIIPLTAPNPDPWSLVLINKYDVIRDTARHPFDRPYMEEEGYATNGTDNIAIRPVRTDEVNTNAGRKIKVFGGKMLTGYEIQWQGKAVAYIDILDNNIWLYNDLEPEKKLILSALSSAILLKRMQDVQKDKDDSVKADSGN